MPLRSALLVCSALSIVVSSPVAFATPPAEPAALEARIAALVGQSGGLTAEEVARRTVASSHDLAARAAEIEGAMAQVEQAFTNYFPRLTLLGRFTRLSPITLPNLIPPGTPFSGLNFTFPVLLNSWTFQAQLAIPISDYIFRINQGHRAATTSAKAVGLSERATRLQLASDARAAYYTWARARLQIVVAEQALTQTEGHLQDVKRLFEVGNVSKADVLRIESQRADAEFLVVRATELEQVLREQLRIGMHDTAGVQFNIGEDVRAELPPLPFAHDLSELQREAVDRRLEVHALGETLRALRDQVQLANAGMYPRLDAVLEGTLADPNQRFVPQVDEFKGTFSASVQMTWSPNDLFASRAQGKTALSKLREVAAQRRKLRDGIRTEVAHALKAVREATAAIRTNARALVAAEEAYRVRRELFRHGKSTVVEVTDAESALTRARLESVGARVDLRIARVRLTHATGRDLGDAPRAPAKAKSASAAKSRE